VTALGDRLARERSSRARADEKAAKRKRREAKAKAKAAKKALKDLKRKRKRAAVAAAGSSPAVAAGDDFSMALGASGSVTCWGRNNANQCTVPAGLPAATRIAAGTEHAVALHGDGTVRCWGQNNSGHSKLKLSPAPERGSANGLSEF
jgi:alpha-tubulin suppressor-like RCC1 family protein